MCTILLKMHPAPALNACNIRQQHFCQFNTAKKNLYCPGGPGQASQREQSLRS